MSESETTLCSVAVLRNTINSSSILGLRHQPSSSLVRWNEGLCPLEILMWKSNPPVMEPEGGALGGGGWGHEGAPFANGISALLRKGQRDPSLLPAGWRCNEKIAREWALARTKSASPLILNFQPPHAEKHIPLVYKPPGLWYSVTAA